MYACICTLFCGLSLQFFCVCAIIICICRGGWCVLYVCISDFFLAGLGFGVEGWGFCLQTRLTATK